MNPIKDFKFHCEFEKNLSNKTLEAYENFTSMMINDFVTFPNIWTRFKLAISCLNYAFAKIV